MGELSPRTKEFFQSSACALGDIFDVLVPRMRNVIDAAAEVVQESQDEIEDVGRPDVD
jgi:hypothetical protein